MLPRIIEKADMDKLLGELLKRHRVAAPVAKDGRFVFKEVSNPAEVRLDYTISVLPPKKFLMPQWDSVLRARLRGEKQELKAFVEPEPIVIFGMHPCDLTATWLLDVVFAEGEPDPHYTERRKSAFIVGLDCLKPCDQYQFCLDMGSLFPQGNFDLFLTDIGESYFVEIGSERGYRLLEECFALARTATNQDFVARQNAEQQKRKNFSHKLPFDVKYLPEILDASYDSLIWQAVARKCFSCGTCNVVCPTCYCFDVHDELDLSLSEVDRRRRWDSCQLDSFAKVAGGESFRHDRSERLRHRFFRKGKYLLEMYGRRGCVGCGRCDRECVAKISSVETYRQIAGSR